jgi:MscS family membrane protein
MGPQSHRTSRWPRHAPRLALALLLACVAGARAQISLPPSSMTTSTQPPAPEEDNDVGFDTPRATMRGFLYAARDGDWNGAAAHLDLRGRDPEDGPTLARELKTVLDRKLWVDLDALSNAPEGDPNDGEAPGRDLVGTIPLPDGNRVKILVERLPGPGGTRQWKVARVTLQQLPHLWDAFGDGVLAERLPQPFFDLRFLDIQLWQWIALVVLLLAALAFAWLLTAPVLRLLRAIAHRTQTHVDDVFVELIVGPVRLAVGTLLVSTGIFALRLALPVQWVLIATTKALLIIAFTWLVLRLIDAMSRVMTARWIAHGQVAAISVVPLARRALKAFVGLVALLAVFQNLGFNATGILAGLGVGGLAVALAAQKSLENLFGGLSLIADQPVRVGDMCRFGSQQGTVEDIGLRSTRVRTLDRTVVTIPNADFATMQIENLAARDRMRLATTVSLRYETTPDQLRWVLVELKRLLLSHPKVSPDPARVRFTRLGACSLDIEIFAFVKTGDGDEFLAVQEDLLLRIIDIVAASGTAFAVPSQVSYAATDPGIDAERQKAAEAAIAAARAAGTLPLPDMPPDQAKALAGALPWPPDGAADRR